jgi:hypothetical protein
MQDKITIEPMRDAIGITGYNIVIVEKDGESIEDSFFTQWGKAFDRAQRLAWNYNVPIVILA